MDYLKVIWNGFMNSINKHHLEDYFIRKFIKAYKKGISFRETYDGLTIELGKMMQECKEPYKQEFLNLTLDKLTASYKGDNELMEKIEIEISKLLYERCFMDFYKYSNRVYFGVVPLGKEDPNYGEDRNFRFVTKEEYEASTGKKIITYHGFISAQEIDLIELEVLKAYLYVLKQFEKSIKNESEKKLITTDTKQQSNPYPDIFLGNDNANYNFFIKFLELNKSDDLFNSISFLVKKMKVDNKIIKDVSYKSIVSFLDKIKFIPNDYSRFVENSSFNSKALNGKARNALYDSFRDKFLSSE